MLTQTVQAESDVTMLVIGCGKMGSAIVQGWVKNEEGRVLMWVPYLLTE